MIHELARIFIKKMRTKFSVCTLCHDRHKLFFFTSVVCNYFENIVSGTYLHSININIINNLDI
jgi:hypothetical protein